MSTPNIDMHIFPYYNKIEALTICRANMEGGDVMSEERVIITTSARGLDEESFPYKLYQKAKKFGIWNPADMDFTQDAKDWENMSDIEKAGILRLIAQFQAGEEAVTLLPLIMAIAKEGR